MITIEPDKSYRVTAADGLYDYDRYTNRTKFQWRGGGGGPFHAGIYAAGEVAPTPPKTQDERLEVLGPDTLPDILLEPSSKTGAPYRIMGVLYQALVPLNDDGTVNWSQGGVGNGTSTSKPEDGKSYAWFQALWVERASDPKKCFIWTVYEDRDYIELSEESGTTLPPPEPVEPPMPPPSEPVPEPKSADTRFTIEAGRTTYAIAELQGVQFMKFKTDIQPGVSGGADDDGVVLIGLPGAAVVGVAAPPPGPPGWIKDDQGASITWYDIDLNTETSFKTRDGDPPESTEEIQALRVPHGIFPAIHFARHPTSYQGQTPPAIDVLTDGGFDPKQLLMKSENNLIWPPYLDDVARLDSYRPSWKFWYYHGQGPGEPISLYGVSRTKRGELLAIKAVTAHTDEPLHHKADAEPYEGYLPAQWKLALPPHGPNLLVEYLVLDPQVPSRKRTGYIEAYSLRTGQAMGQFDRNGNNYARIRSPFEVLAVTTDVTADTAVSTSSPAAGSFLIHGSGQGRYPHPTTPAPFGYELFVWRVLLETNRGYFTHRLRKGSAITRGLLDRITDMHRTGKFREPLSAIVPNDLWIIDYPTIHPPIP